MERKYLKYLSLHREFPTLRAILEEEKERILGIESSKRSSNQKRKLNYIEQAIRNCQNNKTDHNLIGKIAKL